MALERIHIASWHFAHDVTPAGRGREHGVDRIYPSAL
jgi:hypothetical protein